MNRQPHLDVAQAFLPVPGFSTASDLGPSRRTERGLSLVELIVSFTILMIHATAALPLARVKIKR